MENKFLHMGPRFIIYTYLRISAFVMRIIVKYNA